VKRGQTVLLVNAYTEEERECRVVYVGPSSGNGKKRVGLEFTDKSGDFWHVFTPLVTAVASRPQPVSA